MDPGPADLPTAPVTLARVDRTRGRFASLHGDREGPARSDVVHARPRAAVPPGPWGTLWRRLPRRQLAAPRVRSFRSGGEPIYRESKGPRCSFRKNLTQVRHIL